MGLAPDGGDPVLSKLGETALPRVPVPNIWRNRAFLTLVLGMALGLFAQIGLITHMFSLLVPAMGARGAGIVAGLATASAIAGRTLVGWLLPATADRRVVGAMNYGVQIIGYGMFLAAGGSNIPLLVLGAVLFGAGIGNATSMPPLIAQTEFAKAEVVRVVALMTAVSQASYAFAPAVFGIDSRGHGTARYSGSAGLVPHRCLDPGRGSIRICTGRNSFRNRVVRNPLPVRLSRDASPS